MKHEVKPSPGEPLSTPPPSVSEPVCEEEQSRSVRWLPDSSYYREASPPDSGTQQPHVSCCCHSERPQSGQTAFTPKQQVEML
ncbi:hypothetical protein VZT92_002526 [Zoarces viviparus]|uniref:Uncharacterized protein n=1 Tax=Zoarces viviparus TaxID=48416 RepID=A0AAW1G1V2_ZOAVI